MRRALDDLGVNGQRPGRAAAAPATRQSNGAPQASPAQHAARLQANQHASQYGGGGIGPRRNRFAASADVPVVHLPLGRGLGRVGRTDPLPGLGEPAAATDAPQRPAPDDRALRDAQGKLTELQTKLDSLQSRLHYTDEELEKARELLTLRDAELADLRLELETARAAAAAPAMTPQADPEAARPEPASKPARVPRSSRPAREPKVAREPKPVRWWVKAKG